MELAPHAYPKSSWLSHMQWLENGSLKNTHRQGQSLREDMPPNELLAHSARSMKHWLLKSARDLRRNASRGKSGGQHVLQ